MSTTRGDVVVVDWPYAGGSGSKKRPALVIQNDRDNARLTNTVIALITTNVARAHEPTQVLIDIRTLDGRATGLRHDSVINCVSLFTIEQNDIKRRIGAMSPALMQQVDAALKTALELP